MEKQRIAKRGALNGSLLEVLNAPSDPRAWGENQFPPLTGRVVRALTDTALSLASTSSMHAQTAATATVSASV